MTKNILGIDIGGTYIKYGIFTAKIMKPKLIDKVLTASNLPEFITQVLDIVHNQTHPHPLSAVGIGVPAFISKKDNRIELAPNIKFLCDIHLEKEISARTYVPVAIGNDANLAALGEYKNLPKPHPHSFVHLTLGTGIGSGIILDGKLWLGECGFAAELGHVVVNPEGRPCNCGSRGCVETESSEPAIVKSFHEFSGSHRSITAQDIYSLYIQGDVSAKKAFSRAGYYLGILFSIITHFLNPTMITVGGGVAAAGKAILEPAILEYRKRTYKKSAHCTQVTLATQGNDAGVLGAAHLARALVK